MVVHLNPNRSCPSPTPSASSAALLDGVSCVTVPRPRKRHVSRRRASRFPFADKSRDINVNSAGATSDSNVSLSISCHPIKDSGQSYPSCPQHCRASTFQPLLAAPSASSLQLPSFLDFPFDSSVHFPEPAPQPSSPVLQPLMPLPRLSQPIFPRDGDVNAARNKLGEIDIPAFTHPNSPYVPWASPVRREIFSSLSPGSQVSAFSSRYSRPYSRSGARAPEPMCLQEHDSRCIGGQFPNVDKSWKTIRRTLRKNFKRVTNRLVTVKRSLEPVRTSDDTAPFYDVILERDIFESYLQLPSSFPTTSSASVDSSNTTSLATWLATRQPENGDSDQDLQCSMTLDEYEQRGSWTNLSETGDESYPLWDTVANGISSQDLSDTTGDQAASEEHSGDGLLSLQQLRSSSFSPTVSGTSSERFAERDCARRNGFFA